MTYLSRYLSLILAFSVIYYVKASFNNECSSKVDSDKCEDNFSVFSQENCASNQWIGANIFHISYATNHSIKLRLDCEKASSSCYFVYLMLDKPNVGSCANVTQTKLGYKTIRCFQMKCEDTVEASDLEPENYCSVIYQRSSKSEEYSSGLRYCLGFRANTISRKLESNETDPSIVIPGFTSSQNYIVILFVVLFVILVVVIAIAIIVTYKLRRKIHKHYVSPESEIPSFDSFQKRKISEVIQSTKPVRVFILYSRDCEHHQDFVNKLATFFSQANCLVSYNVWEMEKIVTNKVGWISEKLNGDYKILLICSKKGYEKQQAWLQNKSSIHNETSDDQLFLQAIATIMHRSAQAFDYTKLFILRPSYVSQEFVPSDICPGRQYVLPLNISTLLCHLHGVDTRTVDVEDNSLKEWSHCSEAYEKLVDSIYKLSLGNEECDCCVSKRNT